MTAFTDCWHILTGGCLTRRSAALPIWLRSPVNLHSCWPPPSAMGHSQRVKTSCWMKIRVNRGWLLHGFTNWQVFYVILHVLEHCWSPCGSEPNPPSFVQRPPLLSRQLQDDPWASITRAEGLTPLQRVTGTLTLGSSDSVQVIVCAGYSAPRRERRKQSRGMGRPV